MSIFILRPQYLNIILNHEKNIFKLSILKRAPYIAIAEMSNGITITKKAIKRH